MNLKSKLKLKLKNRKQIRSVVLISALLISISVLVFSSTRSVWSNGDYKVLDYFYKMAVRYGYAPVSSFSPRIVYLNITEETYDYFGKNFLDRKDLAPLNLALSRMGVEGIVYDIIFARASNPDSDSTFAASIDTAGNVYLPIAFALSDEPVQFRWRDDAAHGRFRSDFLGTPAERGAARPFHAVKGLMQYSAFAIAAAGSGDITAQADPDSIYRHITMLARVDDQYFPALSLAVFLDWAGASMGDIIVEWGHHITIPASAENYLEQDIVIPIDERGRAFIPYVQTMGEDFERMTVHHLLTHFKDSDLRGNLLDFFEGNFIFIADIAVGTSDLGYTPLEADVPLVNIHASMLNALLTNTFYAKWSCFKTEILIILIIICFSLAASVRSSWVIYVSGGLMMIALPLLTWFEFIHFRLFPVVAVSSSLLITFSSLIIFLEISTSKERAFIKSAFGRYVPEKVVNALLARPEMISLGGEERVVSVLFSDIVDFTTISESLSPSALVNLLNEYFTEMAEIIMQYGGIIDKFQGDAIMAEFGMPVPADHHGDQAAAAAIKMLRRLSELRKTWRNKGIPELHCRIGINTGSVIVGNMGSRTVMDYTVMGDAVNLASRLEGANKRYGTSLIISQFTLSHLTPNRFKTRILDYVKVKGKSKAVKIYEIYGMNNEINGMDNETDGMNNEIDGMDNEIDGMDNEIDGVDNEIDEMHNRTDGRHGDDLYYTLYDQAFNAYLERRFPTAASLFNQALALRPGDKAISGMLERLCNIEDVILNEREWDGSISLKSK